MLPLRQMPWAGVTLDLFNDYMRPVQELVEHDLHDISRRIREYDPTYFLVRNHRTGKVEVHNTENLGNTYCFTNPFDGLDERLLEKVRETDVARIGERARREQIEAEEAAAEAAVKRHERNIVEGIAQETHYHFREAFKHA